LNDLQIEAVINTLNQTYEILWCFRTFAVVHKDLAELRLVEDLVKIIDQAIFKACECRA
jgi:hypothetical protein